MKSVKKKKLSRPQRIRQVLRNAALKATTQVIMTRAEIIRLCKPYDGEEQYLSMALSAMVVDGKVATYRLLNKNGYVLTNYTA
jgi:DNA-binding transcriptional regulator PaaX